MHSLAKSIVESLEFKRIAAIRDERTPVDTAFKAISYAQHAQNHNSRTVRSANLLLPQSEIPNAEPLKYTALDTASSGATISPHGSLASEGDYAWAIREAIPQSVRHFAPVTRQALQIVDLAEDTISRALLVGIENAIDDLIFNSVNLQSEGLLTKAALLQVQTTSICDTLLAAANQIRTVNVDAPLATIADTCFLDTASFQALRTEKDFDGNYLIPPTAASVDLWGLRVIETPVLPAKTGLVLDSQAVLVCKTLLQSGIRTSDSHESLFTRGISILLGEVSATVLSFNDRALCRLSLS